MVEHDTHPVLRSDLWLHKPGERKEPPIEEAHEEVAPRMSHKRARIIKREENKVKREEKRVATAAAKAKAKAVKIDNKKKTKELWEAAKARAVAAKKHEEGMHEFVKNLKQRIAERTTMKTHGPAIARLDWRGQLINR